MARITIDVDLPPEVEITGYQRYQDGHGLEVRWPLPARCRCEKCGHDDVAHIEFKTIPQAIRDLNLWEQPCFWIYQAPFHRCARCNYRQHIIPPFKRKDVSYTYRFEQFVLRSLIGSTAEEVARRLGISAETVDRIVENQLTEDRQIDPQRVITDIGLDELSLKKRHRLDVTLMTDLSDPTRPQILAVERGRDTTATLKCLDRLTQEQRQQVRTHRVDMGPAYPAACALRLPHSRAVTDRFHVAKKFNEVVDSLRKNITREYKAKLTKDQRKAFRSQMWAFRRDPESLSAEEKPALEALFEKIPALRPLYKVRLRFKEIFDTARDRITAARWLRELRRECGQLGLDLGSFFETYDRWKTKILNYFDARQTSAAVEGINNKARVITKRTYGLKSAKSLWDRLILDLNRASQAIGYSIEHIRQMAKGLKALFDWSWGILVATFSGVMSACFSFGLDAGRPIKKITLEHGTTTLWQGLPVLVVLLVGGFTTNFIWCMILHLKNKTGYQYLSPVSRGSPTREEETIIETTVDAPSEEVVEHATRQEKDDTSARVPVVFWNYLFCALAGTTWYFQFFFYTMGETQMGRFKFSSWTLHMASIMIFSTLWGIALREWAGTSRHTRRLVALTLLVLIASTVIIGYGNSLASTGTH